MRVELVTNQMSSVIMMGLPRFPRIESAGKRLGCISVCCLSTGYNFILRVLLRIYWQRTESEYISMSQSKAKYHRLHLDEEIDATSYKKHNKLSIVNWSEVAPVLVIVLALSLVLILMIGSKSHDKEGS